MQDIQSTNMGCICTRTQAHDCILAFIWLNHIYIAVYQGAWIHLWPTDMENKIICEPAIVQYNRRQDGMILVHKRKPDSSVQQWASVIFVQIQQSGQKCFKVEARQIILKSAGLQKSQPRNPQDVARPQREKKGELCQWIC